MKPDPRLAMLVVVMDMISFGVSCVIDLRTRVIKTWNMPGQFDHRLLTLLDKQDNGYIMAYQWRQ